MAPIKILFVNYYSNDLYHQIAERELERFFKPEFKVKYCHDKIEENIEESNPDIVICSRKLFDNNYAWMKPLFKMRLACWFTTISTDFMEKSILLGVKHTIDKQHFTRDFTKFIGTYLGSYDNYEEGAGFWLSEP